MPTVFLSRDRELDETLEAQARLTLILVGVGLGILVLTTAAVYFGYRLLQTLRPAFCLRLRRSGPIANTAETAEAEVFILPFRFFSFQFAERPTVLCAS